MGVNGQYSDIDNGTGSNLSGNRAGVGPGTGSISIGTGKPDPVL
jgi:hypothetical protein